MNDFEAMKATLIQMGYTENPDTKCNQHSLDEKQFYIGTPGSQGSGESKFDYQTSICLGAGIGYGGFCCEFFFDVTGKAITHGCWE